MTEPAPPATDPATQSIGSPTALAGTRLPQAVPFAVLLAIAEAILLAALLLTGWPLAVWLMGHLALVIAAATMVWQNRTGVTDMSPYALAVVATLISGPAGAGLAALALIRHKGETTHPELLAAWYDRIALAGDVDPVTDLYNTVAMGRALPTSTAPPPVFDTVMTQGTLADRQTALGLIARQFQPSYAPALRHALVSPEPVIRVQAAAVAVKVRAELKATLADVLTREVASLHPSEAANLAVDLQAMAKSGLLEDDDRDRAVAAAKVLVGSVIGQLAQQDASAEPFSPLGHSLIETELLAQGRFEQFRALRKLTPQASLPPIPQGAGASNA